MVVFSVALIGIPYLLITVGVLIAHLVKRKRTSGIFLIFLMGLPICLFLLSWLLNPTEPGKSDIIGHYEIDRSRFPGKQADWQHATYAMEIRHSEVIVRDSRTETKWKEPIEWLSGPEYRWKFKDRGKRHHMVAEGPSIYRRPFGYHYVFRSPLYGDVFFRKK